MKLRVALGADHCGQQGTRGAGRSLRHDIYSAHQGVGHEQEALR